MIKTNRLDRENTPIFEGDILEFGIDLFGVVSYNELENKFFLVERRKYTVYDLDDFSSDEIVIAGSIYDNE